MHVLFLDQNKWIDLARVHAGKTTSGPHLIVYQELLAAVRTGKLIAPLTASHILETSKRNDPESRANVVEIQALLSKGFVFRSRKARLLIEMRNALHIAFGDEPEQPPANWTVVPGFMQAFEMFDTLVASPEDAATSRFMNQQVDPQKQYVDYMMNQDDGRRRAAHSAFAKESDQLLSRIEARRTIMEGSTMDLRWRAYAAKLFLDHQGFVAHMLDVVGHTVDEMKKLGGEAIVKFVREVPTLNVEAELAARLEVKTGPLKVNDIQDMHSFCTAIPCAGRLVAERGFISLARQAKLDNRYDVALSTELAELQGIYL
ncbi:hypothetical protein GTP55_04570 [Duganella sp. FT109W]|uniref:DUF4935 domain-containing protein n=1 Tax=Duganella margarita TaxID=2692170 RepID=A0ABW9WC45_9BURK|nr:hypothetical protein [Duganella margarita]MYN38641.1 hypothetical protein [Duganella margarita]